MISRGVPNTAHSSSCSAGGRPGARKATASNACARDVVALRRPGNPSGLAGEDQAPVTPATSSMALRADIVTSQPGDQQDPHHRR
jgi:hypothetical protein